MINKKTGLLLLLAGLCAGEIKAGNLTSYATGDVLICFRLGGSDLVVDAGPVSALTNASPNQRIAITQYTANQLAQVGLDGVNWSAFTYLADNTLFVSQARTDLNTQTAPYKSYPAATQSGTALRIATIPPGAKNNIGFNSLNTSTAVIEPDNSLHTQNANYPQGQSYENCYIGSYGGFFNGTFTSTTQTGAGEPENTIPSGFATGGTVIRSDFYRMNPAPNAYGAYFGIYLGYFEMATDGTLSYVAYPSGSVSTPVIQSISRSGTQTTIYYTTGVNGTYTLRKNNVLNSGIPRSSWATVSTLSSGDTSTHSITFTDTSATEFYTITAQ